MIEESIPTILSELPRAFAVDMWAAQLFYPEVWVEKDALSSVIERACGQYRVPYMACKGYLSASEAWRAGKRFKEAYESGRIPVIIHLGDHDPSGIDMSRDNEARVSMFAETFVDVRRIALNMDQVRQYNPPPNPAKVTDSRAKDYIGKFGTTSWELDALEPDVIVRLVGRAIRPLIEHEQWTMDLERETKAKELLGMVEPRWDEIEALLTDEGDHAD